MAVPAPFVPVRARPPSDQSFGLSVSVTSCSVPGTGLGPTEKMPSLPTGICQAC